MFLLGAGVVVALVVAVVVVVVVVVVVLVVVSLVLFAFTPYRTAKVIVVARRMTITARSHRL